jgi:pilus assembly protein CpaB
MKMRGILMLGTAILVGGAAVMLAQNALQPEPAPRVETAPQQQIQMGSVVVATVPLKFGNAIRREHLRAVDWPLDSIPTGAFAEIDQIVGNDEEARVALRSIEINEPVLKTKVSGFGGRGSLANLVSADMRAYTIRSNVIDGVAGFVMPGDKVDIMLTRQKNSGGGNDPNNMITDVLLQSIKVLAINQTADDSREDPAVANAVTVEVTPKQAQKLTLAQQVGKLTLALRNVTNAGAVTPDTITLADLKVGEANTPPAPIAEAKPSKQVVVLKPRKPSKPTVRVVRGLQSSTVTVEKEAGSNGRENAEPLQLTPQPSTGLTTPKSNDEPILLFQDSEARIDAPNGDQG